MSNIFGNLSLVSLLTLVSRVLGLVRDILFFGCFGASMIGEAFILAFTFPNLFRRMFGEGTMTSAFVPIFSEKSKMNSNEVAFSFLNQVMTRMIVFLGLLSLAVSVTSFWLSNEDISLLEKWKTGFFLNGISFSYIMLICCSAVLVASLNCFGRFFEGAFSPLLLNCVMISAMLLGKYWLLLETMQLASLLCVGVLLAGLLQISLPWIQLKRLFGWRWKFSMDNSHEISQMKSLFWVGLLGAAVAQLNILVSRLFAYTLEGSGGMSYLFISSRLIELPLGVFAISIATVWFPAMANAKAKGDEQNFWRKALGGLRLTTSITIPAAIGLAFLGESTLIALFRWGEFGDAEVSGSAEILRIYCLGLPFYAVSTFLVKIFHSEKNMKIPVQGAMISLVLNVILSLVLVNDYKAEGLAWANVASAFFQMVYLSCRLDKLNLKSLLKKQAISLPVIFIGSLVMFVVIYLVKGSWGIVETKVDAIMYLSFTIPIGLITYLLCLLLLGFPELSKLLPKSRIEADQTNS